MSLVSALVLVIMNELEAYSYHISIFDLVNLPLFRLQYCPDVIRVQSKFGRKMVTLNFVKSATVDPLLPQANKPLADPENNINLS